MTCVVQIGTYPLDANHICGGVEASVYGLAKVLKETCEVHVFDIPRIDGSCAVVNEGGVVVHRFNNTGGSQFTASRQVPLVAKEIVELRPNVCHIHGTSLFAWRIYRRLKKRGKPVVVTVHGLALVEKRNALKKGFSVKKLFQYLYQGWVEKRFLSQLTTAVVDTEYVKNKVNGYPIRQKPKMVVIPQGIDESFYCIECSKDSKMILSVGAIGERKGHLLLLNAFERAVDEGIEAQLVIAGTVAEAQYLERLQKAIAQSICRDRVSLLIDLTDKDLKQLYENAHLFALHSEEESQGIVFAEAMATGMPVVATKVGGVPFVVIDGVTGLLSDYGDINAFAENIKRLMLDSQLWRNMSNASKESAETYHGTSIKDRIMALYGAEERYLSKSSNLS